MIALLTPASRSASIVDRFTGEFAGPTDGFDCLVIRRWLDHQAGRYRDLLRTIDAASRISLATVPVRR